MGFLFGGIFSVLCLLFTFSSHCIQSSKYFACYSKLFLAPIVHRPSQHVKLFVYGVFNVRWIKVDFFFYSLLFSHLKDLVLVRHSGICYRLLALLVRLSERKTKIRLFCFCQWYIAVCNPNTHDQRNEWWTDTPLNWTQTSINQMTVRDIILICWNCMKTLTTVNKRMKEKERWCARVECRRWSKKKVNKSRNMWWTWQYYIYKSQLTSPTKFGMEERRMREKKKKGQHFWLIWIVTDSIPFHSIRSHLDYSLCP